jgi:hypothetical protein
MSAGFLTLVKTYDSRPEFYRKHESQLHNYVLLPVNHTFISLLRLSLFL